MTVKSKVELIPGNLYYIFYKDEGSLYKANIVYKGCYYTKEWSSSLNLVFFNGKEDEEFDASSFRKIYILAKAEDYNEDYSN